MYIKEKPSTIAMVRKNEHQGEATDPRKSTAEFGGRTKNMKVKTNKKTTEIKYERESERDHWQRKWWLPIVHLCDHMRKAIQKWSRVEGLVSHKKVK